MLCACAVLPSFANQPPDTQINKQLNLSTRALQQYPPADLPQLLAHVSYLPPNCWPSKRWCVTVMNRLQPQLTTLGQSNPRVLALTAWALGRMGLKLRQDFAELLLSGFKAGLQLAEPRDLALIVHGLAGCKCRPDAQWVGVYLARVQGQLSGFKGQDLAMMLGALVRLR